MPDEPPPAASGARADGARANAPDIAGAPDVADLSFDDAFAALQATVAALESGGQPLEETLALYERAVSLQRHCERLLAEAELRVSQLVSRAGGALGVEPVLPEEAPEP